MATKVSMTRPSPPQHVAEYARGFTWNPTQQVPGQNSPSRARRRPSPGVKMAPPTTAMVRGGQAASDQDLSVSKTHPPRLSPPPYQDSWRPHSWANTGQQGPRAACRRTMGLVRTRMGPFGEDEAAVDLQRSWGSPHPALVDSGDFCCFVKPLPRPSLGVGHRWQAPSGRLPFQTGPPGETTAL